MSPSEITLSVPCTVSIAVIVLLMVISEDLFVNGAIGSPSTEISIGAVTDALLPTIR